MPDHPRASANIRKLKPYLPRAGISAIGLLLVAAFALLHAVALPAYEFFTRIPDGISKSHPFIDLWAILQAGACWRAGVDVYAPSACLGGGTFNYSPFLLRAAWLPIGPGDTLVGGLLFCAAFFAALALLPPPKTRAEFLLRLAASLSPASYYALEQGNLDAAIFALTLLTAWLLINLPRARLLGYGVFAVLAAAKFYPVALGVLILRAPFRLIAVLAAVALAGAVLFLVLFGHDFATAVATIPSGTPFRASFGRIDLPRGLVLLHILPPPPGWRGPAFANMVSYAASLGALGLSAWLSPRYIKPLKTLAQPQLIFLIAGASLMVFCFYAAQNIEYRAIFLLPALPGLWQLRRTKRLTAVILLLLWEAVPRDILHTAGWLPTGPERTVWLLREALWWWVIVELGALILAFMATEAARLRIEARSLHRKN